MSGRRGRYGTGRASFGFEPPTAVLSPLERFYGPAPVEPREVPACPACGGRPCPGCAGTAVNLWGEVILPTVIDNSEPCQAGLFD